MTSLKTAILISCSDHYAHRLAEMDIALKAKGYQTQYITSDFDHTAKQKFKCQVENCVQLHAKEYRKNLSAARIVSHFCFARDVYRHLEKLPQQPDVIVALLPPNFLGFFMAKYKKRHPRVRLIFDIFDLWPETFPSGRIKRLLAPVFGVWAWLRNNSLPSADYIITECDLFRQRLGLQDANAETVYLCAQPVSAESSGSLRDDRLELCYLGAINNVIGIEDICFLLRQLTAVKPVTLHIIGKGEQQDAFLDSAKAAGAEVIFYGAVFDVQKKQSILNQCHFGLNIMKSSVCVGLTMKSIDYFRYGLPVINSIPADTRLLLEKYSAGIQTGDDCAKKVLALTNEDCMRMRKNAQRLFDQNFAKDVVDAQYRAVLDKIL